MKVTDIKFQGIPSSGSRTDTCGKDGREDRQKEGQKLITKLTGADGDYAQTPQKSAFFNTCCIYVNGMDLSINIEYFPIQH